MLCYKDKTFCNAPCAMASCSRKFTDQDKRDAKQWWGEMGGEPPVSFGDLSRNCPSYVPTHQS